MPQIQILDPRRVSLDGVAAGSLVEMIRAHPEIATADVNTAVLAWWDAQSKAVLDSQAALKAAGAKALADAQAAAAASAATAAAQAKAALDAATAKAASDLTTASAAAAAQLAAANAAHGQFIANVKARIHAAADAIVTPADILAAQKAALQKQLAALGS